MKPTSFPIFVSGACAWLSRQTAMTMTRARKLPGLFIQPEFLECPPCAKGSAVLRVPSDVYQKRGLQIMRLHRGTEMLMKTLTFKNV